MTPERFGPYLLTSVLGRGAATETFVAVALGDESARPLALKRVRAGERSSGAASEALRREIAASKELSSVRVRGLVEYVDDGEVAGLPFLVTDLVRGTSLARAMADGPVVDAARRVVACDLARCLAELHEAGWVHGDISPNNVLLGDDGQVVLIDLGLAAREGSTRPHIAGTPGYAPRSAAIDRRALASSDVFGWGVLAAELELGERLFPLERELAHTAARSDTLPAALAPSSLPARAMHADARERPSARALLEALDAADGEARSALAEHVTRRLARSTREGSIESADAALEKRALEQGNEVTTSHSPAALFADSPAARSTEASSVPESDARVPSSVDVASDDVDRARHAGSPPHASSRPRVVVLTVAVVAATALGFAIGRARGSARTTLTTPMLPANVELAIDGNAILTPEPGRALPIAPGRHTLTLTVGKREPKDFDIAVERGDRLIVVPLPIARAQRGKE